MSGGKLFQGVEVSLGLVKSIDNFMTSFFKYEGFKEKDEDEKSADVPHVNMPHTEESRMKDQGQEQDEDAMRQFTDAKMVLPPTHHAVVTRS